MNRLISAKLWMQSRRVLTAFLAGLTVFTVAIGLFGAASPAQAASAQTSAAPMTQNEAQSAPAADQTEGLLDNIREKLNLDEPLPESTKLFFKQIQGEDVEVEEPHPSGKGDSPNQ